MRKTVWINQSPEELVATDPIPRKSSKINAASPSSPFRLSVMPINDGLYRGQSMSNNPRNSRSDSRMPASVDEILRVQSKILQRFRKNEEKYIGALNRISGQIERLKNQTAFIKVDQGRTVEEYLTFKNHQDVEDRRKRLDCLGLLNSYAQSSRNANPTRILPLIKHYYAPPLQAPKAKVNRHVSYMNS